MISIELSDRDLQDEIVAYCRDHPWCDADEIRQDLVDYCDARHDVDNTLSFFMDAWYVIKLIGNCLDEKTLVSAFDVRDRRPLYSAVVA